MTVQAPHTTMLAPYMRSRKPQFTAEKIHEIGARLDLPASPMFR